ncbi:MAG: DUF4113 domain-containing protein [Bacteroidaceae bacterium]|nr:DUF4113 domain-containing protein [Bacteroidaceae bacterium]
MTVPEDLHPDPKWLRISAQQTLQLLLHDCHTCCCQIQISLQFLKTDPKARYQGYSFYFREQFQRMRRLDAVIDRINRVQGTETIVLGAQQYTRKNGAGKADVFANAIKHDYRSPNPTTRWTDIIRLK